MRSLPTVVAALLLGGLGLIATRQTQVFSPGAVGLPIDARLVEQLGDQVNNFADFGPDEENEIGDAWRAMELAIPSIDGGTDMTDVTNIVAFFCREKATERCIFVRTVYFSQ